MTLSSIVTIAGAKGGVGKTTTSLNVASALAESGRIVGVVEMDLAMANFLDFLSIPCEDSDPTLHDVLAGDADPAEAMYEFGENVTAIPSGTSLDGYAAAELDRLPDVLSAYADELDILILDTGAGLNRAVVDPMRLADGAVVVSTPRIASVRDAEKTIELADRVDTDTYGLVLTQSGTGQSPGPDRISEFLDVDLLGHVPDDETVPSSQDSGIPVVDAAPDSPAGSTYQQIAENLLLELSVHNEPVPQHPPTADDVPPSPETAADESDTDQEADTTAAESAMGPEQSRSAPEPDSPSPTNESTEAAVTRVVDGGTTSTADSGETVTTTEIFAETAVDSSGEDGADENSDNTPDQDDHHNQSDQHRADSVETARSESPKSTSTTDTKAATEGESDETSSESATTASQAAESPIQTIQTAESVTETEGDDSAIAAPDAVTNDETEAEEQSADDSGIIARVRSLF